MGRKKEFTPRQGEEILYELRTHPKYLVPYAAIVIALTVLGVLYTVFYGADGHWGILDTIVTVIIAAIALRYGGWPILKWWSQTYTITNKQIIVGTGIIFRDGVSTSLSRVSTVSTKRGLLDRIFKCGTMILYTSAGNLKVGGDHDDEMRVTLHDIPNVLEVRDKIAEYIG